MRNTLAEVLRPSAWSAAGLGHAVEKFIGDAVFGVRAAHEDDAPSG